MILQPHIYVMNYIKGAMHKLRSHPEEIGFLLGGFCIDRDTSNVYGAAYIDKAIKWITENEFTYALGYRLDSEKYPSVTVYYEGGVESEQFIGDIGETVCGAKIPQRCITKFIESDIEDGGVVASSSYHLEKKIWRTLVLTYGNSKHVIKDITKSSSGDTLLVVDPPIEYHQTREWSVKTPGGNKIRQLGSSLDSVRVTILLTIPGDPELAEVLSAVLRYILKQSRLALINQGLHNPTFSHTPISRSREDGSMVVWNSEFSISGELHDRWILLEVTPPEKFELEIVAKSTKKNTEEVVIYP